MVPTLLAHSPKLGDSTHIALAPTRNAAMHPLLLARDFAVELMQFGLLLLDQLVAPGFECSKTTFQPPCPATVQPNRNLGQALQETPIMRDQYERRLDGAEFVFDPFDGRQIEMVSWFIKQQDVWSRRHGLRDRRSPRLATGKGRCVLLAG